jgi:vancomycin resistance protein YoaR
MPGVRRQALFFVLSLLASGLVLGFVFAGSSTTLAKGVAIDGVDVGGLEMREARTLLQKKSDAIAERAVVFVAGGKRFPIRAKELGVQPDWTAAVEAARRQGDGFGPIRGFRRLDVSFFGADVTPPTTVLTGALQYELGLMAAKIDRKPRDAAVVRDGLRVTVAPARLGRVLDRRVAAETIVHALASLDRTGTEVHLPLRSARPRIGAPALARAARQARIAMSAPVRLQLGATRWLVPRSRLAQLLQLPAGGRTTIAVGGPDAQAWLAQLGHRVDKPARDADFAVDGTHVRVVPDRAGIRLDPAATAGVLLKAALKRTPEQRVAQLPVVESPAKLTTAEARAMGISGVVASYTTEYGGVANRIHNVQLVAHLVDDKLIAPGATFSFNATTGERNAAKGFLEAPVIVNGELTTGLGGGVCQVSTTVFNAAFDAGLKITERTNHALYIGHYPQGRDATVDYPGVDMKFVNDTDHWLLLRTVVGSSSLTVSLYGTPTHRRVESSTAPLASNGSPPVKKTVDPTLKPGETVVDDQGVPPMTTSVERKVYDAKGKLLYDDTWYSSYRPVPALVRIGPPKRKPGKKQPGKKQPGKKQPVTTTTTQTTTQTTQTQTGTRPTQ